MTQTSINYATALYELGISGEAISETEELLNMSEPLVNCLVSPVIDMERKFAVIDRIFPGDMRNFLKVVCRNQSMDFIEEIFEAYKAYANARENRLTAVLYYVEKPDETQREGLKKYLMERFHCTSVELNCVCQPKLIGGFVLCAGDFEMDRSVSGKIRQLQQKLLKR